MTILTVDDEPQVRKLLATILQQEGFAVLTAGSAGQALSVFHEHSGNIDLLITDVQMPGLDGVSLAALLQSEQPKLKVLLMSGYCSGEHLSHGFGFLAKPFSLAEMLATVDSMLGAKEAPPSPPARAGITGGAAVAGTGAPDRSSGGLERQQKVSRRNSGSHRLHNARIPCSNKETDAACSVASQQTGRACRAANQGMQSPSLHQPRSRRE